MKVYNYESCMVNLSEDLPVATEDTNMTKWDLILKGKKRQTFIECTLMGIDHNNELTVREICDLAHILEKKVIITLVDNDDEKV